MPKSETSLNELLRDIRRIEEHREVLTENKIRAMYRSLMDDLDTFLAKGYKKYADDEGRFYLSYLDAQNKRAKFLQEIVENVDNLSPELKKEMLDLVENVYTESYKGMVEAVQKADTGKKLETATKGLSVRPEVIKQAVNNNISKLTLPLVLEKHRAEIIYQIQQELNIGLMNGDRYEKMAKRISERLDVSYSKAMNIARTETHRNIESGLMDCGENLNDKLQGSDHIYAVTWCTMKDERVRPQQRRKTKKGWKTSYNKNGTNHMVLDGQTVKVGEMFNLGDGVKAKAPSQSGVASHDCNCRCFLEYNLMTPEEFAKATGQTVKAVEQKYYTYLKLYKEEEASIVRYISSDSYKINEDLRNGNKLTEDMEVFKKTLDNALKKMPEYKGTVTRSLQFMYDDDLETFLKEHKADKVVLNKSYISTTKGKGEYNPDGQVQMIIKSKKGRDVSMVNEAENEVLFERNSKFKVKDVYQKDGKTYIEVEEVTD